MADDEKVTDEWGNLQSDWSDSGEEVALADPDLESGERQGYELFQNEDEDEEFNTNVDEEYEMFYGVAHVAGTRVDRFKCKDVDEILIQQLEPSLQTPSPPTIAPLSTNHAPRPALDRLALLEFDNRYRQEVEAAIAEDADQNDEGRLMREVAALSKADLTAIAQPMSALNSTGHPKASQ